MFRSWVLYYQCWISLALTAIAPGLKGSSMHSGDARDELRATLLKIASGDAEATEPSSHEVGNGKAGEIQCQQKLGTRRGDRGLGGQLL